MLTSPPMALMMALHYHNHVDKGRRQGQWDGDLSPKIPPPLTILCHTAYMWRSGFELEYFQQEFRMSTFVAYMFKSGLYFYNPFEKDKVSLSER